MQVQVLVRWSSSLSRWYRPNDVQLSRVALKPPGENMSSGGPDPVTS
jgi:hypothetical protein